MNATAEFAIGSLTVIELTGKDRNKILNNLCTQDLRSLQTGQVKETFILDVKGRTVSHGIVACFESSTLFVSGPGQAQRLVPHIDRYIIREDAAVRDASAEYDAYLLSPDSPWVSLYAKETLLGAECSSLRLEEAKGFCMAVRWLGPDSTLLIISGTPNDSVVAPLLHRCRSSDCLDRKGWELQRIQNFWPWYGVDLDEKNLPQEIGIDSLAISFNKGCYLGQETVARLDALGQVQKRLVRVELQCSEDWEFRGPLELFTDGKSIGWLSSACKTEPNVGPTLWIGLAMLRRSYLEPGSQWQLDQGGVLKVTP